jgi:hypothetical protein
MNWHAYPKVPFEVQKAVEQCFSPMTLERLRQVVLAPTEPNKTVETPVYEYQELARSARRA